MARFTDSALGCMLKLSTGVFAVALAISLSMPSIAMAQCEDCITGQTACTYGCGKEVNCSKAPYTQCGCVICNTCCIG